MATYRRILAAADLREDGGRVIEYAAALARSLGAEQHVVHVVEPLPTVYGGEFPKILQDVHTGVRGEARRRLREATRAHEVPAERCHIVEGAAATRIRRLAKDLGADLVVVGTHRRRGLDFFMGSTSNAVLHDDAFDVLAVRLDGADD